MWQISGENRVEIVAVLRVTRGNAKDSAGLLMFGDQSLHSGRGEGSKDSPLVCHLPRAMLKRLKCP
jgi:hypothetical protein